MPPWPALHRVGRGVGAQPVFRQGAVLLCGVEAGPEIGAPRAEIAAQQAVAAEQETGCADPGSPLPQRAVMPQVAHRLAQGVRQEDQRHAAHPPGAPGVVAAERQVEVEGGALVLGFLGAVPQPQGLQARLAARQPVGVGQHPVGQDGGEVFVGGGDGQAVARVQPLQLLQPCARTRRPAVDQALPVQVRVEQAVQPPVRGLLADETLHLVPQRGLPLGRQGLQAVAHGIDEELLADRKAHRQRIEERGAEHVAPAPVARQGCFQIDQQAAHHEFGQNGSPGWLAGARSGRDGASRCWYCQVPVRCQSCLAQS
jgi:hypothetical protein